MTNKYALKKYLRLSIILVIIITSLFFLIQIKEYQKYNTNTNQLILSIIELIKNKYPDISDNEIITLINSNTPNNNFANKYSIIINEDTLVKENQLLLKKYLPLNTFILSLSLILTIILFLIYNGKKDREINSITKYIEEINHRNYKLDLDDMNEDELSILKNEIYKITIMLKEQAENSLNDKIKLKNSLSDISHQLKTPLTSIMIMLDNLIDAPDMPPATRIDFIKDIKIEITNINFLVQSLLKLSKLDSNTVNYINTKIKLSNLIDKSTKKILPLCDLKNIDLSINIIKDDEILCDEAWQVEALSNIIKNCCEHTAEYGHINISCFTSSVYTKIEITDNGSGIDDEDLPHIFERFYKGKNSDSSSIGIGLALAKTIINKNNGTISVKSVKGKGTSFTIKYFK